MNAVNPLQTPLGSGGHAPAAAEPSMEEILASIRRIIADDQSFPGRSAADTSPTEAFTDATPSPPGADAAADSADAATEDEAMHILRSPNSESERLEEAARASAVEPADIHAPQFASPEGPVPLPPIAPEIAAFGSVDDGPAASADPSMPPRDLPPRHPDPADRADGLFSPAIDSSVANAFNTLAASRLVANSDELKGLVREMIRPLLKAWIDEHLPDVVERLVTTEIERIARGAP